MHLIILTGALVKSCQIDFVSIAVCTVDYWAVDVDYSLNNPINRQCKSIFTNYDINPSIIERGNITNTF